VSWDKGESMELDLERIMILLQRRYNALREIDRLTDELQDSISRNDEVSASLFLDMRGEELAKCDECQNEIWLMAENKPECGPALRNMMKCDPFAVSPSGSFEERKIYEIRQKSLKLIEKIQEKDKRMNRRVGGDKSYYARTAK